MYVWWPKINAKCLYQCMTDGAVITPARAESLARFGIPELIFTDNRSGLFEAFLKKNGIEHVHICTVSPWF